MRTRKLVVFVFHCRLQHLVASKCSINICCVNDSGMYKMLWEQSGKIGGERKRQHLR